MLNLSSSRIIRSDEVAFLPSAPVTVVGQILVQNGPGYVKPGTGASTELFVGVSLSQPMTLTNFPKVEALVANAGGTIVLAFAPIAGTLRLFAPDIPGDLTVGTPGSQVAQYSVTGVTITQNVARAGRTTVAYYQYVPDTITARLLQGDTPPGGAASLTTGTVGVIRAGIVYTTEWDSLVDWTVVNPVVRVGANARFTIGGTGAVVGNAQIMAVPNSGGTSGGGATSTDSLLGLYFGA